MIFDFASRPPEINSALIYSGPGAGPMMAAAAGWNNLAAEMHTAAASYESTIAELAGEQWRGSAAQAMATAVEPYLGWMSSTAAAAEHAAAQATASAVAYQNAYAMTVPPSLIATNRTQLATLVASNILGQNTAAIMINEAQYAEMWAQDAVALYRYAAASASAAALQPLTSPAPTTNPAGTGAQSAAVSTAGTQSQLNQLVSSLPGAVQGLSSPGASGSGLLSSTDGFLNDLFSSGSNVGIWNDFYNVAGFAGDIGAWNGFAAISAGVVTTNTPAAPAALVGGVSMNVVGSVTPTVGIGTAATPVLADLGRASTVGRLSVPPSWSTSVADSSAETAGAPNWAADVDDANGVVNVATGMPAMTTPGRGGNGMATPRYGVKPTVMPQGLI